MIKCPACNEDNAIVYMYERAFSSPVIDVKGDVVVLSEEGDTTYNGHSMIDLRCLFCGETWPTEESFCEEYHKKETGDG